MLYRLNCHRQKYKIIKSLTKYLLLIQLKTGTNRKYAVMNIYNKIISEYKYDIVIIENNIIRYRIDNYWGLLNKLGVEITGNKYQILRTQENSKYIICYCPDNYIIVDSNTGIEKYSSGLFKDVCVKMNSLQNLEIRSKILKNNNIC